MNTLLDSYTLHLYISENAKKIAFINERDIRKYQTLKQKNGPNKQSKTTTQENNHTHNGNNQKTANGHIV